mmetsp:Transcript_19449/g.21630  ORF Transcript_19449/g.21630 Transcript_19449/m.21630 type:complete len:153 (-) Transcript_19449:14-472(-)
MHNIIDFDSWYDVTTKQLYDSGMKGLYMHFGSIYNLLQAVYPHTTWDSTRLKHKQDRRHHKFWTTPESVRPFLDNVASALQIVNQADWHRVSFVQLRKMGGAGIERYWPSVLSMAYPNSMQQFAPLQYRRNAQQRWLKTCTKRLVATQALAH